MGAISLYAELLLNIRQVTVFVTLPTIFDDKTQIQLSPNRRLLIVTHNGEQSVLDLPSQTAISAEIKIPTTQVKELSFRLSISQEDLAAGVDEKSRGDSSIWPASALSPTSQFACRTCKNIIVQDGITAWKDLPSENWAEMMDFWHCHKPHVREDDPGANVSTKGYAASDGFMPMSGIGFVDELHLRMLGNNCRGLKVSFASRLRTPVKRSLMFMYGATRRRHVPDNVGHMTYPPIQLPEKNPIIHLTYSLNYPLYLGARWVIEIKCVNHQERSIALRLRNFESQFSCT